MDVRRVPVPTDTRAPTGATNAYRVGDCLVDPAGRTDRLDAAGASHLAVTHTHPDHVGGVADYADGRTVWALSGHADRFAAATGVEPDRTFAEGDSVAGLSVLETPGHAVDHVTFCGEDAGEAFALPGDLATATGSIVVGPDGGGMAAYLDSLRRLRDRNLDVLYPGHGDPIEEPAERLAELIDHRLAREQRVREAIEAGNRVPEAIREAAYERDLSGVSDLATRTVIAHIEKLAAEGVVEWDSERVR
ncbi:MULTISPECIES: MBL fold metallo-hydrolase [Saliphagus]|uniref:MBL fold metallo-hydrolase n=1 Tax=Saliphagus infecundisoli TaxID=1849069 RepID=A0ABD5QE88_9EURY|nr:MULTISPECIES: MBL fold metallo-hydrolase [Saliphagus]